jgi:hypothetical protein
MLHVDEGVAALVLALLAISTLAATFIGAVLWRVAWLNPGIVKRSLAGDAAWWCCSRPSPRPSSLRHSDSDDGGAVVVGVGGGGSAHGGSGLRASAGSGPYHGSGITDGGSGVGGGDDDDLDIVCPTLPPLRSLLGCCSRSRGGPRVAPSKAGSVVPQTSSATSTAAAAAAAIPRASAAAGAVVAVSTAQAEPSFPEKKTPLKTRRISALIANGMGAGDAAAAVAAAEGGGGPGSPQNGGGAGGDGGGGGVLTPTSPGAGATAAVQQWEIDPKALRLKFVIGKGNFGEVWLATWLGSPVAVKTILPALQSQEKLVRRFLEEINLMSALHHPNVVLFLGACTRRPNLCLVLEHCTHGSLHHFLKTPHEHGVPITMSLIYRFALDIARGVYYLHRRCSVVQRDLKARNILVDGSLNAKVADFGLSRVLDDEEQAEQNKLTACGTPAWTAPEIVRMERYTDKVDVFSFGVVMWELIAREEPYGGQKGVQIAYAAAEQGLRPEIPSFCPPEYAELMSECWADDPDERPSFAQILKRLFQMKKAADHEAAEALAGGEGVDGDGSPRRHASLQPLPRFVPSNAAGAKLDAGGPRRASATAAASAAGTAAGTAAGGGGGTTREVSTAAVDVAVRTQTQTLTLAKLATVDAAPGSVVAAMSDAALAAQQHVGRGIVVVNGSEQWDGSVEEEDGEGDGARAAQRSVRAGAGAASAAAGGAGGDA